MDTAAACRSIACAARYAMPLEYAAVTPKVATEVATKIPAQVSAEVSAQVSARVHPRVRSIAGVKGSGVGVQAGIARVGGRIHISRVQVARTLPIHRLPRAHRIVHHARIDARRAAVVEIAVVHVLEELIGDHAADESTGDAGEQAPTQDATHSHAAVHPAVARSIPVAGSVARAIARAIARPHAAEEPLQHARPPDLR